MNVLNKIKSKQTKTSKVQNGSLIPNDKKSNVDDKNANYKPQIGQDRTTTNQRDSDARQNGVSKSAKKLLNKVQFKIRKNQKQDEGIQILHMREQPQTKVIDKNQNINNKYNGKINQKENITKQKMQKPYGDCQSQIHKKIISIDENSKKNESNKRGQGSKEKINKQYSADYCENLRRCSESPTSAHTDIFDDILPTSPNNKIKRIVELSSKNFQNARQRNQKNSQNRINSLDKESQGTGSFSFGYRPPPIKDQQMPKAYNYLLLVKKGYQIGKMSVFQGHLEKKVSNKELSVQLKYREVDITFLSCKNELIPNPQSISHIFISKMVEIGVQQYMIRGEDIIKVIEKPSNRK